MTVATHAAYLLALGMALRVSTAVADHHVIDLEALDDDTWTLVDQGGITSSVQIMAYSGGWFDSDNDQFCIFGGGHFNYSGNEVWCFDTTLQTWKLMYEPDVLTSAPYEGGEPGDYSNFDNSRYPGALFSPAGEDITDALPASRHTYDALEFAPGFGAILWGGIAWGDIDSPWCTRCNDTWVYSFPENDWTYLFNGKNPSPNESPGVGASAYSTKDGRLYSKVLNTLWSFDPDKNRWSEVRAGGTPPWTIEGTLEYNPDRHSLYFFGGNYEANYELWEFDIAKRRWSNLKPAGDAPSGGASNGPGLAYDTRNRALVVYSGGTVWSYDPDGNAWNTHAQGDGPTDESYVFGRFRYDARNNGFWLHAMHNDDHSTWFYRLRN